MRAHVSYTVLESMVIEYTILQKNDEITSRTKYEFYVCVQYIPLLYSILSH